MPTTPLGADGDVVTFWALQFVIALVGLGFGAINPRITIVTWLALAVQFISFFWMLVPSNQILFQALLFLPAAFLIGLTLEIGGNRFTWWVLGAISAGTLLIVRTFLGLQSWFSGFLPMKTFTFLCLNSLLLAAHLFIGLSAAHGIVSTVTRRRRSSQVHPM